MSVSHIALSVGIVCQALYCTAFVAFVWVVSLEPTNLSHTVDSINPISFNSDLSKSITSSSNCCLRSSAAI